MRLVRSRPVVWIALLVAIVVGTQFSVAAVDLWPSQPQLFDASASTFAPPGPTVSVQARPDSDAQLVRGPPAVSLHA